MNRREFLRALQAAAIVGAAPAPSAGAEGLKERGKPFGNARLLHVTDTHAQLLPTYYREPNVNIGTGPSRGRVPHIVGRNALRHFGVDGGRAAHAVCYLDFKTAAERYGRIGGFAHLKTLIDELRGQVQPDASLLLDGGDLWQGSATAYWTRAKDMVEAGNQLGIDLMTGHWEFTYEAEEIRANLERFNGEFLAQNVYLSDEAAFMEAEAFDEASGRVFKPYAMRELNGKRVAIIGQAFPYQPIANPSYFIPDWRFGIRESELQDLVEQVRKTEKPQAVVLLSHNGMDVDLKLASRVTGIDIILGGHTHDVVPQPSVVNNPGGQTVVANGGASGKFVGVLDLDIGPNGLRDYRYRLLPVFADSIDPDPQMGSLIDEIRAPYADRLGEELAVADDLFYRRGNFNGSVDQLICDAARQAHEADIALSPGFRWGTTLLPGQTVTMEDVMAETAITYPETYVREMSGEELKLIMEDVCDNLFNVDPYYQQGGDMVRVAGMTYTCDPTGARGKRITAMRLDDGAAIEPTKSYRVTGWATVNSRASGPPIWEVVADYLRERGTAKIAALNGPRLKNVSANPGVADYGAKGLWDF